MERFIWVNADSESSFFCLEKQAYIVVTCIYNAIIQEAIMVMLLPSGSRKIFLQDKAAKTQTGPILRDYAICPLCVLIYRTVSAFEMLTFQP